MARSSFFGVQGLDSDTRDHTRDFKVCEWKKYVNKDGDRFRVTLDFAPAK